MSKNIKKICEECEKEYWGQPDSKYCSRKCVGAKTSALCKSGKEICKTAEEKAKERIERINGNFGKSGEKKPNDPSISKKLQQAHVYRKKEPSFMKRLYVCRG